jgi:hypothetical protein
MFDQSPGSIPRSLPYFQKTYAKLRSRTACPSLRQGYRYLNKLRRQFGKTDSAVRCNVGKRGWIASSYLTVDMSHGIMAGRGSKK